MNTINRPLEEPASAKKGEEHTERKTGVYTQVREDLSTGATKPFEAEVGLCKRSNEFELIQKDHKLTLCWQKTYLTVDFLNGPLAYRQKQSLRKEAIAKAVGIKGDYRPSIIDATAGLGRDAFILASLGCEVILIEQHPMVAALLEDGLKRLLAEQALKMRLMQGDAIALLKTLESNPDVVYLDPLFPPRKKSALVKKDMQMLQKLTHDSYVNNEQLLEVALQCASKRVVVKRPDYAPPLGTHAVDFAIKTPHHRFDVYLVCSQQ